MCGIVGCVGERDVVDVLETGLRNLEYRGYDSAGIALREPAITVHKDSGTIENVDFPSFADAHVGIGHTRWSTHGEPTAPNAHPHTDCDQSVAVVHNGIIENHVSLRAELGDHAFTSDTDTEVIPHLFAEELSRADPVAAFRRTVERLEGSFAVAAVVEGFDGILLARRDSPLVVGDGDRSTFVASDVTAFLEYTDEVRYLQDGDVGHVTADAVTVYNDGVRVERATETVDWDATAAEKGGYDHYMKKEIYEQPDALEQALTGRFDGDSARVSLDVDLDALGVADAERIHVLACGTSYHAGLYARTLLERYADVPVTVERASEYAVPGGCDPDRTLAVAVTQSGETADTLAALGRAASAGMSTLAVTNTVGSTVTRAADETLYIHAGPEIGVAATKTFASQVVTVALFTLATARARGTLGPDERASLARSIAGVPDAVSAVLDQEALVRQVAREYSDSDAFFYLGRRLGYPVALEGALKLKEISYDHAEGFSAGELKHGPLALVTEDTPIIGLATAGTRPEETMTSLTEAASRGAPLVVLTSSPSLATEADTVLEVPTAGDMEPLVANVYLQLFSYHVADLKDRRIDKPRNLAKSVTVD